ncbi:MAG: MFS transporter, partial [Dehalococcoidia bacterium]
EALQPRRDEPFQAQLRLLAADAVYTRVVGDATPPEPPDASQPLRRARRALDDAYLRADRALDTGQARAFRLLWFFLPETSIAREPRFQQVLASRFLSDAGQQALAYGALIAVVRSGGSAFEAALVGVATVLPAAALGLVGGAVADQLPKRVALAAAYNLQALLCFVLPSVAGTELVAILALVFAVSALGQVSGPTESSVLPLVATDKQLASAASLVNLASSAGTAFGTALLAPVLVRAFGVDVVFYVAGALLFLAASRVFDLPAQHDEPTGPLRRPQVRVRATIVWLLRRPAVASMIAVGVVSGTANLVIQMLAPLYVASVLGLDPAEAVYVFAPSAIGLVTALAVAPAFMRWRGERIAALCGFVITTVALLLLGDADAAGAVLDPVNPIRLVGVVGIEIGEGLRTAGLIALFLGFGVSLTTTSVQTYINRRVPLVYQGRAFALQSTLKNGVAIVPLLSLGAAATTFGVERVLLISPLVLLLVVYALIQVSFRFTGIAAPSHLEVVSSFWEEPEEGEADLEET